MNYFKVHPFARMSLYITPILLVCIYLMNIFSPKAAPGEFKSFILAFEFARTVDDTDLLLSGLPARTFKTIETGIYIDFGFMIAYSILLILFLVKSAGLSKSKWLLAGIPLVLVIFFADFSENIYLLKITKFYTTGTKNLTGHILNNLHIITWIKWGGLAIVFLVISVYFFRGNWLHKLASAICFLPFLSGFFAIGNSPLIISIFTNSVFAAFGALIIYSFLYRNKLVERKEKKLILSDRN